jgi:hypothetical protein
VKIKVEQSGGLANLTSSKEIDVSTLPTQLKTNLRRIMDNSSTKTAQVKANPPGSADYYNYKVTIVDGTYQKIIICNQFNIPDDLKSIIGFVKKHSGRNQ